uniref:Predicted protein n=1 Tax=Hordeum vulgare subsp. vulgare TaxID=112509 RepID=F2DMZ0_HORVV|nr:predicted protein [Hordeum vulgare subsp. vulgare]
MGAGVSRTCAFSLAEKPYVPSADNSLKLLIVSANGNLLPVVANASIYSVVVPNAIKVVTLTPVATHAMARTNISIKSTPQNRPRRDGSSADVHSSASSYSLHGLPRELPGSTHQITSLQPTVDDVADRIVKEEEQRAAALQSANGLKPPPKPQQTQMLTGAEAVELPKSFKLTPLDVGDTELVLTTLAENGQVRSYLCNVSRQAWDADGWKPGTHRDKFRWYCHGAADGNPLAQFRLALMYAGEGGAVMVPQGQQNDWNYPEQGAADSYDESMVQWTRMHETIAQYRHYQWLLRAAQQDCQPALSRLGRVWLDRQVPDEVIKSLETDLNRGRDPSLPPVRIGQLETAREAVHWLSQAVKQGDTEAAVQLAYMYLDGVGVQCDFKQALNWFRKANQPFDKSSREVSDRLRAKAEQGDPVACYQFGLMHIDGVGVPVDYKQAIALMSKQEPDREQLAMKVAALLEANAKKALAPGPDGIMQAHPGPFADAAFQLALMHAEGVGAPIDYKKVLLWLERAGKSKDVAYQLLVKWITNCAEQGNPYASEQLALMYTDGVGVHTDYKHAISWFIRANEDSKSAEKRVVERLLQSANKNPRSAYQLALMYIDGVGVETDFKAAMQWLDKASQAVTQAHKQAAEWFQQAAETGDKRAAYQMALMCLDGIGVAMSYKNALVWLEKGGQSEDFAQQFVSSRLQSAAEKHNIESANQLAVLYMEYQTSLKWLVREGKPESFFHINAAHWYRIAAEEGDTSSAQTLAQMHVDGVGVPIDFKIATHWFEKAGKTKEFAKHRIDAKLQSLKPKYKSLFLDYSHGQRMDLLDFQGFYRDCLMAKGLDQRKAEQETNSVYNGVKKYEALFASYDESKDRILDFEEVWSHPHTHTNLFPKTGKHVMAANTFFANWTPRSTDDTNSIMSDAIRSPTLRKELSRRNLSSSNLNRAPSRLTTANVGSLSRGSSKLNLPIND